MFGDETEELYAFYEAQEIVAPGACYTMRELLGSWQPWAKEHSHTLPDGYTSIVPVLQKFKSKIEIDELDHMTLTYIYEDNVGSETGLAVAANGTHGVDGFLVREVVRRCNYDREALLEMQKLLASTTITSNPVTFHPMEQLARDHDFISLRGIEFITEENLMDFTFTYRCELHALVTETLAKLSFPVITIHDEFKCHANHVNAMREVYRDILAELADSTVGQQMIRELRNDPTYILTKFSDDLGDAIMKSEYFLS